MTANTFSSEDYQLSGVNQLGMPLDVYRLKPGSIRFPRIAGLLIFITGIVSLVLRLTPTPHPYPDSPFQDLFQSFYDMFVGGVLYGLTARQAQSMRVIVCEHGLLQIRKIIRRNRVEVVHWKDILAIDESGGSGYSISYRDDSRQPFPRASLTLTGNYQQLDELVALITEHSKKFVHEESEIIIRSSVKAPLRDGMKYRCPCCGYKTLNERGEYEICAVCFWEDDGQDYADANTNRILGPNHISLTLGRENYQKFGATQKRALASVRPPLPEEM